MSSTWELTHSLPLSVSESSTFETSTLAPSQKIITRSKELVKSDIPTRHIGIYDYQDSLIPQLKHGEIRNIYPHVTAGITIVSYFKLTDAKTILDLLRQDNHRVIFITPCSIQKKRNERIFVTVRAFSQQNLMDIDYMEHLNGIGKVDSISEVNISDSYKVINIEYDDERAIHQLHKRLDSVIMQGCRFHVYKETVNDRFLCHCEDENQFYFGKNHFLWEPISSNANFTSFFSLDPFATTLTTPDIPTRALSFDSASDYDNTEQKRDLIDTCCSSVKELAGIPIKQEEEKNTSTCWSSIITTEKNFTTTADICNSPTDSSTTTSDKQEKRNSFSSVSSESQAQATINVKSSASSTSTTSSSSCNSSSSHTDKKNNNTTNNNEFDISKSGQDGRTTFMIRNIPNKYTQQMLIDCINETHANTYDFLYLRIDFKNKCNVGYAFINFINVESVVSFAKDRAGKRWKLFNSDKKCELSYANIQGKEALIRKFKNSQVMDENEAFRPKLFYTSGKEKGKEQPFPKGELALQQQYESNKKKGSRNHHYNKKQR